MMVKIGFAEMLLANGTRVQGHYEVTLTRDGAAKSGYGRRTRASGVIRLGDDARTLTDVNRALLVRFDRKVELLVRVSSRVDETELIHFTSEDAADLEDKTESVAQQFSQLSQRL